MGYGWGAVGHCCTPTMASAVDAGGVGDVLVLLLLSAAAVGDGGWVGVSLLVLP